MSIHNTSRNLCIVSGATSLHSTTTPCIAMSRKNTTQRKSTPSNLEKWRSSLESITKHQLLPYLGPSNSVRHGRRRLVPVAGDHHGRPYQVWSLTQLCSIFFLYKANDLSGRLINDPHRGGLCSILMYLEGLFELTRPPSRALD